MSRSICLMLCSVILVFSSAVVHSQPGKTALVGGTVYPVSAPPIENGVVLINGDTIEAVGAGLSVPRDYQRIDVTGKSVFPGLINAYTNLGLHELDTWQEELYRQFAPRRTTTTSSGS